jgi:ABC-2 type transport system permease protein
MLAAGLAYCSWSRDDGSLSKFLIGGLIGAIVGYFISEMLLQKQVKVFGKYKGLLIYILVIAAVVVGFKMDLTGYEKKVPKAENVESIYFHSGYRYKFFGMLYDSVYDTDEMIDSVIAFHKEIIKQRPTEGNIVNISYELKNGKSIERTYRVDEGEMYDKYYKAMFESVEFKQNTFPLWTTKQEDLYNADIHPYNLKENIRIKDPQELKELITIVKDEILNESYEEMKESIELGRISFHGTSKDEQNISLNDIRLRSNYVELISWLREKGYYDDIVILPQDIKEIAIGMTGDEYERGENVFNRTGENNYMYIKDKDKIQQILDSRVNAVEMDDGIQDRIVYIQYNWSDNIQTLYISTNNEPEFIKK